MQRTLYHTNFDFAIVFSIFFIFFESRRKITVFPRFRREDARLSAFRAARCTTARCRACRQLPSAYTRAARRARSEARGKEARRARSQARGKETRRTRRETGRQAERSGDPRVSHRRPQGQERKVSRTRFRDAPVAAGPSAQCRLSPEGSKKLFRRCFHVASGRCEMIVPPVPMQELEAETVC